MDDAGGDLGTLLRQARERRGVTVDEVARRTKIPKRHLESLERNNLAALPPGMYRRAEVLAFAAAVGLDRQQALSSLARAQEASSAPIEVQAPEPAPAPVWRPRHAARLGVVAFVVLGTVIGTWRLLRQPVAMSPLQTGGQPATGPPSGEATATAAPVDGGDDTRLTGTSLQGDAVNGAAAAAPVEERASRVSTEYPDLIVVTDPPGARITVDGVGWGPSPLTIRFLPPGVRRVRATLDGHVAQERVVTVPSDAPRTTVRLTLKPGP